MTDTDIKTQNATLLAALEAIDKQAEKKRAALLELNSVPAEYFEYDRRRMVTKFLSEAVEDADVRGISGAEKIQRALSDMQSWAQKGGKTKLTFTDRDTARLAERFFHVEMDNHEETRRQHTWTRREMLGLMGVTGIAAVTTGALVVDATKNKQADITQDAQQETAKTEDAASEPKRATATAQAFAPLTALGAGLGGLLVNGRIIELGRTGAHVKHTKAVLEKSINIMADVIAQAQHQQERSGHSR